MSNGKNVDAVAQKLIRYAEIIANNGDQTKMNGKIDSQFSQNGPAEASIFQNMVFDALSNKAINEEEAEYLLKNYAGITTLKDATVTGEKKPGLFKRIMQANGIDFKEKPLKSILTLVALPFMLVTGCTKNEINIDINITIDIKALEELLEEVRNGDAEWKNKMITLLQTMLDTLTNMQARGEESNELLHIIIGLLGDVINNQNISNEKMDLIIQLITTLTNNMGRYFGDLQDAIGNLTVKFTQFSEEVLGKFNELFGKLDGMDRAQQQFFAAALNYIQQIIDNQHLGQEKQDQLYNLGLEILNKLDIQPGQAPDYTELLNAILDKLNNIDANTSAIIDNINNLNEDMLEGIQNIMNNANSKTREIIAAMDAGKAELALILQGLRADVQGLDQEVLDKLTQIIANQNTQIDNQGHIIANQEATGQVLNQIKLVIDAILAKLNNEFPQIRELLQDIYYKIPAGCHCQSIDLTAVIELLNEIIEKIGNGNGNDEGVLNELEEELGIS